MRVLLVDDHTLVRKGIASVVQQRFPEAEVYEAAGADDAVETLKGATVDVALVDVRMPGGGARAARDADEDTSRGLDDGAPEADVDDA